MTRTTNDVGDARSASRFPHDLALRYLATAPPLLAALAMLLVAVAVLLAVVVRS
jgi:hypothetical protein